METNKFNFVFNIEFNQSNLDNFNFIKNIEPILLEFDKYNIDNFNKKNIIDEIKRKIYIELEDEKDLLNVYKSKIIKLINSISINMDNLDNLNNKIKEIIENPLEGEMAKHNKIKVVTIKILNNIDNNYKVIFYVKYKEINEYNKQIKKLYNTYKI
jgi:hypothetical protein